MRQRNDTKRMHKSSPNVANKRGFTLVEVMMASFVLVFVLLGTLTALQQGFTLLDTARNTTLAGQVIQSEIEDLRLRPWVSLPTSGTIDLAASIGGSLNIAEREALAKRFTAIRTITDVSGREANFKNVTVSVTWTDLGGRSHIRNYQTLLGRNGLSDYFVTTHTPPPASP